MDIILIASTSELLPTFKKPTSEVQKVWPLPATLPRLLWKSCDRHGCGIQLQEIFLSPGRRFLLTGEALIEIMSNKTGGDSFSNYSMCRSMQSTYMFLILAIWCNLHVLCCVFGIINRLQQKHRVLSSCVSSYLNSAPLGQGETMNKAHPRKSRS